MPLVQTRGAASAQGFGEFAQAATAVNYIEDVYSTYLYTGNGSTQTITNGIDLSTKGGLVWAKGRNYVEYHGLFDSARGVNKALYSNATDAQATTGAISSFNTTGFSLGGGSWINENLKTIVSWTFRKQPKFFDVVTYTGNGSTQNIAHNLGSVPGCIIVKETSAGGNDWQVYHRSTTNTCGRLFLNLNNGENASGRANTWGDNTNPVPPTSTVFTVGNTGAVNNNGASFVAYVFAHDAGGFGLTATDNVISCSSYTGNGSANGPSINLGYEPQFVIIKQSSGSNNWEMYDNMRGVATGGNDALLNPNLTAVEQTSDDILSFTATGFQLTNIYSNTNGSGQTYIYIAIRRGPMKVPTSGTSVFALDTLGGTSPNPPGFNAGFPVDLGFFKYTAGVYDWSLGDRLRGAQELYTNLTSAEVARADFKFDYQDGWLNSTGVSSAIQSYNFRRAPSFFDEVCYTGTNANNQAFTHNLGAVPELMIIKMRVFSSGTGFWFVYSSTLGYANYLLLNSTAASASAGIFGSQNPDSSSFYVSGGANINSSASQYVAYLFATAAGVSKVGSYTGTGALQTVNCGFTSGARFVLIKRTDSTGDWWTYDSARGITSGNDPYLYLNSTAAEVTGTNYVDTDSTGFKVTAAAPAGLNASGGTYIFLAIA